MHEFYHGGKLMLEQLKKYGKYKEYFAWEFENKVAFITSCMIIIIGILVRFYEDFNQFVPVINDLCIALIGAYVGSLALIFSGVIFLGSLLNNRFEKKLIKYSEDEKIVEKLYASYLFLAFNILVMIIFTILVIITSNSNISITIFIIFWGIVFLYSYLSFFILAYFVAIIRNTVDLILISRNSVKSKSFYERANEVRIDMMFQYLYRAGTPEETKKQMKDYFTHYIDTLEDSDELKDELMKYFSHYYYLDKN